MLNLLHHGCLLPLPCNHQNLLHTHLRYPMLQIQSHMWYGICDLQTIFVLVLMLNFNLFQILQKHFIKIFFNLWKYWKQKGMFGAWHSVKILLPVWRGSPFKNHSTTKSGSGYGSMRHSMWALWPSINLSGPVNCVTNLGFCVTTVSTISVLWYFDVSSRCLICWRLSGCWGSRIKLDFSNERRWTG